MPLGGHLRHLPSRFRLHGQRLCRLQSPSKGLQIVSAVTEPQMPFDPILAASISKKPSQNPRHGTSAPARRTPRLATPNRPMASPPPANTVPPTRSGIVHTFPPGVEHGLTPKNLQWHDTNDTANLAPHTRRLEELKKVWKSQVPDDVRSEVLFMGDKGDSDKYLVALENGDRRILSVRKTQIRELLALIHTSLWYEAKPKILTTLNALSKQSPQPGAETGGWTSASATIKTTSDSPSDTLADTTPDTTTYNTSKTTSNMEDDTEDDEPWDSGTTISYKEHRQFLRTVVKQETLLNYLNTPLPPIAEGFPLPQKEPFQREDIPLILGLLGSGPRRALNFNVHTFNIGDAVELVGWLESCSVVDLKSLNIWKQGTEDTQRKMLTKFIRHLLGIGNGDVIWHSVPQAKASLKDRVRHWRNQAAAGEALQSEWKPWGVARITDKKMRWWRELHEAGWVTTKAELKSILLTQAALNEKADKTALDGKADETTRRN
ncbi:hypothetical protein EV426DRAFT_644296 [Tirmania nivea]|nr:hypothetical protein EV426DRAFT_644296 [Tirmania nivea]